MATLYMQTVKNNWKSIFDATAQKTALGLTSSSIEDITNRPFSTRCPILAINVKSGTVDAEGITRTSSQTCIVEIHCFIYDTNVTTRKNTVLALMEKVENVMKHRYACNGACRHTRIQSKELIDDMWNSPEIGIGLITAECEQLGEIESISVDDNTYTYT